MPAEYTDFNSLYADFMFWSIIVGVFTFIWLLYSVIVFRRGMVDESKLEKLEPGTFPRERDDIKLEITWIVLPTLLIAWLCVLSWNSLYDAWGSMPPEDEAFVVEATATQWNWAFTYTEPIVIEESADGLVYPIYIGVSDTGISVSTGTMDVNLTVYWENNLSTVMEFNISGGSGGINTFLDTNEVIDITIKNSDGDVVHTYTRFAAQTGQSGQVYVPCGRDVIMKMKSEKTDADAVLHALFLPEWAVKEDVVPNLETIIYFTPQETGTYDLLCAEYCGMRHAYMTGKITVVPSPLCEGGA